MPELRPHDPDNRSHRFRLMRVRSPLLTQSLLLSFRPATEMFQFTDCPLPCLWIQQGVPGGHPGGLPHSEILGSTLDCNSPRHIAAYRVLHRLFAPRHPSRALRSFNTPRYLRTQKCRQEKCPMTVPYQNLLSHHSIKNGTWCCSTNL